MWYCLEVAANSCRVFYECENEFYYHVWYKIV